MRFEPRNDRMSQCSLRVWVDSYLALNGELNLSSKVTSGHNLSTSVSKFDCSTQEQSRAQHGVANYINSIFVQHFKSGHTVLNIRIVMKEEQRKIPSRNFITSARATVSP